MPWRLRLSAAEAGAGPKAATNGGTETQTHTYSASAALNRATQRHAIRSAINAAYAAVRALTLTSNDDDIAAARATVDAVTTAIAAGTDLPAHEINDFMAMQAGIQSDLGAREAGAMAYRDSTRLTGELAALPWRAGWPPKACSCWTTRLRTDTDAQAQLRAAIARYMAAEGMQTLPADASMDTPGAGPAEGCHGALHGRRRAMQTLPEDASMDTPAQAPAEGCHGALHGPPRASRRCPRTPRWTRRRRPS